MSSVLILDIETDSLDVATARVRVVGMVDAHSEDVYIWKVDLSKERDRERLQKKIDSYDIILTYNGEKFDVPILQNYKVFVLQKKHRDLYQIIKHKRPSLVFDVLPESFSLKEVVKHLKLDDVGKGVIDYNIFKKEAWTKAEQDEIVKYLEQDLRLTLKLWKFLLHKFETFKSYISEWKSGNYFHITSTSGAYAYEAVCNMLGVERVIYNDVQAGHKKYKGAYVSEPVRENAKGAILYFDFTSLYPMLNIQANLFSHNCICCKDNKEKWHGDSLLKVTGHYCKKNQGSVEKALKKIYLMRKEYKKNNDPRQAPLKIVLNSIYGISGNESFALLYNENTSSDCTALGRQCIQYAIKRFEEEGFKPLYSDTDSIFVECTDIEKCKMSARIITEELMQHFPFPWWDEFSLKLEDEIKYIQFFRDDKGRLKKKNYIYINKDDKMVVKGLDIIKSNTTALSKAVFSKLKPTVIANLDCKFRKDFIVKMMKDEIEKDIGICSKKVSIKSNGSYISKTSLQWQILQKYGEGEHQIVKNSKMGVGKKAKYCTLQEFRDKCTIHDLDYNIFLDELKPFILENTEQKKLEMWGLKL